MRFYEYQHIQTGEIKKLNATVYLGEIILYDENWWYGGSITYKFSEWKRIEYQSNTYLKPSFLNFSSILLKK